MTTPPVWSNYPAGGETPPDCSQELRFSEPSANPTQRPTTSLTRDPVVVTVTSVVVLIIAALMIGTVVLEPPPQSEINVYDVDKIFDPPIEGLRNAQASRVADASEYFNPSRNHPCAVSVFWEAETVQELQSVEGPSREIGWAVAWNSTSEAQKGFDSVKKLLLECRKYLTVIEASDLPDRYVSFSGDFEDDSGYFRIAMMQYGNVVVLTQLTGDRPIKSWSKAIANRVDLLA